MPPMNAFLFFDLIFSGICAPFSFMTSGTATPIAPNAGQMPTVQMPKIDIVNAKLESLSIGSVVFLFFIFITCKNTVFFNNAVNLFYKRLPEQKQKQRGSAAEDCGKRHTRRIDRQNAGKRIFAEQR